MVPKKNLSKKANTKRPSYHAFLPREGGPRREPLIIPFMPLYGSKKLCAYVVKKQKILVPLVVQKSKKLRCPHVPHVVQKKPPLGALGGSKKLNHRIFHPPKVFPQQAVQFTIREQAFEVVGVALVVEVGAEVVDHPCFEEGSRIVLNRFPVVAH